MPSSPPVFPSFVVINAASLSYSIKKDLIVSEMGLGLFRRRATGSQAVVVVACSIIIKTHSNFNEYLRWWKMDLAGGMRVFSMADPATRVDSLFRFISPSISFTPVGAEAWTSSIELERLL